MNIQNEIQGILRYFKHPPTNDQETAIKHLAAFGVSRKPQPLYLLKGFAGTGKTSLISAFVNFYYEKKRRFVLLAPTGRAAKVLALYTGFQAYTIHQQIYRTLTQSDESVHLVLAKNPYEHTVFVVDEASMISDSGNANGGFFSSHNLLDDLMTFVFSREGNKLLLVGDTAQLPPVGLSISPALNLDYLHQCFQVTAFSFEMKEVMRQALDSGILSSATYLRKKIEEQNLQMPFFLRNNFHTDVEVIEDRYMLEELLQSAFANDENRDSIVITRTNKSANRYNQEIRNRVRFTEEELEAGDRVMVVKNNYFWTKGEMRGDFIANGDMILILQVNHVEKIYGSRFADVEIRLLDDPHERELSVKILMDSLVAEGTDISNSEQRRLYDEIVLDYMSIPQRTKRNTAIKNDPFYNALHIKYAYAVTCHKTQGGQWPVAFVDQGYITNEMVNIEYLRWLYTAVTRATKKLYLINFRSEFFD